MSQNESIIIIWILFMKIQAISSIFTPKMPYFYRKDNSDRKLIIHFFSCCPWSATKVSCWYLLIVFFLIHLQRLTLKLIWRFFFIISCKKLTQNGSFLTLAAKFTKLVNCYLRRDVESQNQKENCMNLDDCREE